jgi:Predicted transcriptional regulators
MQIGDRIKEIRGERGLTVRQLAERTGMSFGFLSDCENNKSNPSIATCDKIAEALGVPVSRLLGELPEDSVKQEGDAFTATWRCAEAGRLAELLRTFDDWVPSDRQELISYLTAKEAARAQKNAQRDDR